MTTYAAVILYYRAGEKVRTTLRLLLAQTVVAKEIVIVDNDSGDGVLDTVLAEEEFSTVRRVTLPLNSGYAGGMNVGEQSIREDVTHVLFITHEVAMVPSAMTHLLAAATQGVVVVGPLLLRAATGRVWSAGGTLNSRGLTGHRSFPLGNGEEAYDVAWLDGAALLVKRDAFEVLGGFDERYFLYWEDVDLGVRASELGRVVCAPSAVASQETGLTPPYFAARNRILFWRQHGTESAVVRAIVAAARDVLAALVRRRPRVRDAVGSAIGAMDGLSGALHLKSSAIRSDR